MLLWLKPTRLFSPLVDLGTSNHSSVSLLGLLAKIKCSICSYQLNIWYAAHWVAHILNWFLELGCGKEACLVPATGCLGIALPPSTAHFPLGKILIWINQLNSFKSFTNLVFVFLFLAWKNQDYFQGCFGLPVSMEKHEDMKKLDSELSLTIMDQDRVVKFT